MRHLLSILLGLLLVAECAVPAPWPLLSREKPRVPIGSTLTSKICTDTDACCEYIYPGYLAKMAAYRADKQKRNEVACAQNTLGFQQCAANIGPDNRDIYSLRAKPNSVKGIDLWKAWFSCAGPRSDLDTIPTVERTFAKTEVVIGEWELACGDEGVEQLDTYVDKVDPRRLPQESFKAECIPYTNFRDPKVLHDYALLKRKLGTTKQFFTKVAWGTAIVLTLSGVNQIYHQLPFRYRVLFDSYVRHYLQFDRLGYPEGFFGDVPEPPGFHGRQVGDHLLNDAVDAIGALLPGFMAIVNGIPALPGP